MTGTRIIQKYAIVRIGSFRLPDNNVFARYRTSIIVTGKTTILQLIQDGYQETKEQMKEVLARIRRELSGT